MNESGNKKFDLEERLIDFAVSIINITENLNNKRAGNHIAGQLVKTLVDDEKQAGIEKRLCT